MSLNSTDRPWIPRYRMIIQSMLPENRVSNPQPPYQRLASFVTAGKPQALPEVISALNGLQISRAIWHSIGSLQHEPDSAKAVLSKIMAVQSSSGQILPATADDHPESVWYFELQLTHALASAGLLLTCEDFLVAAQRAALFILNEIQPDHATSRPWGLNAFLLSQPTLPLADWVLHSTMVHLTTTEDEITLLLLEDCLYSLPS